ncbi:MAG TPA: UDP-N-acetylmuramoyl-L-alanyl-D-glutamate--2,6-diaminopimelate ligase [Candidatus Baltobacteraceae bacterium]
MKTLHDLLGAPAHGRAVRVVGDEYRSIETIVTDSRRARPGALFVALTGERLDARAFIPEAVRNGVSAIAVNELDEAALRDPALADVSVAIVGDTRRWLSRFAVAFYDDPARDLDIVGVTGTNGKTTTIQMVAAILDAAGKPCGTIGTIGAHFGTRTQPIENTTPFAHDLHAFFAQMRDDGARAVALEVSSHSLELDRVADVPFAVGAFTNLTRDHLDFHHTIEAYARAKHKLFEASARCVFNVDDAYGKAWAAEFAPMRPVLTYSLSGGADLVATQIDSRAGGSTFSLDGMRFEVKIAGRFNVANALCAIACARLLGVDDATAARGLAALDRVAGRMERVPGDVEVVVDYSHTPDSLDNALRALRPSTRGRLTVVFGCGGDRDRGKRAQMGEIAARLADGIYVTSDNPRGEDPQAIADEILGGIGTHERVVELDRRVAIRTAIARAAPGDAVLIAGKGHETYQIVGSEVLPFDDAAVAREALAERGTG